jgi:GxxExxY protein
MKDQSATEETHLKRTARPDGHDSDRTKTGGADHAADRHRAMTLRIPSPLSGELELLIHRTIGCCIRVHTGLGPGLLESIVTEAVCIELETAGLSFEREKRIPITYRGRFLSHHRLDLVVAEQIVLELKSVERLNPVHHAQVLSYLRASGLKVGLLMNFNVPVLQNGLRRIVL